MSAWPGWHAGAAGKLAFLKNAIDLWGGWLFPLLPTLSMNVVVGAAEAIFDL